MAEFILPLENLIEQFEKLPGIGRKTAVRLAFSILDAPAEQAQQFSQALLDAKTQIKACSVCGNICTDTLCDVCADPTRDHTTICVVEDARTVLVLEKVKEYHGLYHVLGGAISPMGGIGPDQLRIQELLDRITASKKDDNLSQTTEKSEEQKTDQEVREIILATNPNIEGETTAMYLSKLLRPYHIKLSRLAYGVPVGSDLDYADEVTLYRAIEGRREL